MIWERGGGNHCYLMVPENGLIKSSQIIFKIKINVRARSPMKGGL